LHQDHETKILGIGEAGETASASDNGNDQDGREELLTDYTGCSNNATQVLGCAAELCLVSVVCRGRFNHEIL
jgi:hypothetical protein